MSGGNSSTPVVQTQTKDPWIGQQAHLSNIFNSAANLAGSNFYTPYSGPTQADLHTFETQGLGNIANIAMGGLAAGTQNNQAAQALANRAISNNGITPNIDATLQGLGGNVYPQYQNIANAGGLNAGLNTDLQGLSNVTSNIYGSIYGNNAQQSNPYLQGALDAQGRKIADQVNSAMSGAGRYGSGAHTNVLSRNLAEAADPILAQDYQNRQQNQLQAAQGMLSGLGQQAAINQQGIQNQMGAISGQAGILNNMLGGYQQGLNQAGQFSQLSPTLDQAQYAPAQELANVGNIYSQRAQAQLQDQINLYNAQQAYPWENLGRYAALVQGGGNLGGTTVTSTPTGVGAGQSALGGALAGGTLGSSFGPLGALAGAGAGGLFGYLNGR